MTSSVAISIAAKVPAMTANCSAMLRPGSTNCGRNAAKRIPLGLVSADSALAEQRGAAAFGNDADRVECDRDRRCAPDLDAQPDEVGPPTRPSTVSRPSEACSSAPMPNIDSAITATNPTAPPTIVYSVRPRPCGRRGSARADCWAPARATGRSPRPGR